jgi:rSAM/selenodomain-associated transferase 2
MGGRGARAGAAGGIAVVIPTLDEAAVLGDTLAGLPAGFAEVVVADGGSADDTVAVARAHGCRVVEAPRGRGPQMNAGAAVTRAPVLLFLHADTRLPEDAPARVAAALADPAVAGGGFSLGIASRDGFLALVAAAATLRTRLTGVFYGDQAVFVRRGAFEAVGGFPPYPIMEDVAFGRALKTRGRVVLLPQRAVTSARRWERENPLFTTLRNWALVSLFLAGVSPERLARWYRPVGGKGRGDRGGPAGAVSCPGPGRPGQGAKGGGAW